MATKRKARTDPKPRPGVQVVLRVPAETRKALESAANTASCSMNHAAITRLDTGRWPRQQKEAK